MEKAGCPSCDELDVIQSMDYIHGNDSEIYEQYKA